MTDDTRATAASEFKCECPVCGRVTSWDISHHVADAVEKLLGTRPQGIFLDEH